MTFLLSLLLVSPSAFSHPTERPSPPSANPKICELMLRTNDPSQFEHALFPDFGPTLFELFPYDLLARTPMLYQPLYFELMDAGGLLQFIPDLGETQHEFHRAAPANRRLGYRWTLTPERLIDESPIVLLPAEMQKEILSRVLKQLEPLQGQSAQFLRMRVQFLWKKAHYTRNRLDERPSPPPENFLDDVPAYLRPQVLAGLEPSGSFERENAWREFYKDQVKPFLPMNDKAYLALLSRFVTIEPLDHEPAPQ